MDLNLKLIEKIKEFNDCGKLAVELNRKINNNEYVNPVDVKENAIQSLCVLDELFEMESDVNIRNLHWDYLDYLEKEDYVKCHHIVDELKKIN